jgi:uncharacterized membrane protein
MPERAFGGTRGLLPSLIAVAAILLLALMPNIGPQVASDNQAVEASHGRIQAIVPRNPDEPLRPPFAQVEILEGPKAGQVVRAYLEGPGGSQIVANYQIGDEVVVTTTLDQTGQPYVAVSDRWRAPLLGGFILIFAIAVVLVGGFRGIRALLSLGLTIAVILKVLLPLVVGGVAPVPLAVITATGITVVTILLTEGWSRTSGAAILGTAGALALTGLLAAAATALASFTYSAGSDLAFLQTADGVGLDLRGLLLAAFILGGVGVLDDVTVTQAALVASLADQGARGRRLVEASLDVGRSHIAATVNTLFLAYVGAGLPLIVTILVSNQPRALVFNSEEVATEVIRTIVGSLGIIAAVPFTTLVAAAVVGDAAGARVDRGRRDRSVAALAGVTAVIILALGLTAVLPLGQGRSALTPEAFGPSSIPGAPDAEPSDGEPFPSEPSSSGPAASGAVAEPVILAAGEPFVLAADGSSIEVTVSRLTITTAAGGHRVTIEVTYRNKGPGTFVVDPTRWSLIAADGEAVALAPLAARGLEPGFLAVGAARSGGLEGVVRAPLDQVFVSYTDADDVVPFVVPAG